MMKLTELDGRDLIIPWILIMLILLFGGLYQLRMEREQKNFLDYCDRIYGPDNYNIRLNYSNHKYYCVEKEPEHYFIDYTKNKTFIY